MEKHEEAGGGHYLQLLAMALLSFIAMFVLMYAMVDTFADVYVNVNQFYMAGLMTAPMVLIEIAVMAGMYKNKRANAALLIVGFAAAVGFWMLIRYQGGVDDGQFLRSMIPHHSGAILMCEKASIGDVEIVELCKGIVSSQQAEIDQMRSILARLGTP